MDPRAVDLLASGLVSKVTNPADHDGPPIPEQIALPCEAVQRAGAGDDDAVHDLRQLLGISPRFWEEYQISQGAVDRRLDGCFDRLQSLVSSPWEQMAVDGLKAQTARMCGRAEEALEMIDPWLEAASSNPYAKADLFRRKAVCLLHMRRFREADQYAQAAVHLYENVLSFSGYDPYSCGTGSSLWVLGQIQGLSGRHMESVVTFRNALSTVDISRSGDLHGYIVGALAVDLAAVGTEDALAEARTDLAAVRAQFFRRGAHRCTYHMARLDWLEGSLIWRTAKRNRYRGRNMVRRGRDLLTELQVPLDAACCATDLELMWKAEHRHTALMDLKDWLNKARGILPTPLVASFEAIADCLDQAGFFAWDDFHDAVRKFRARLGKSGSVLPSLVSRENSP